MKAGELILLNAALVGRAFDAFICRRGRAQHVSREGEMIATGAATPRRRKRHSYDETLDEPAKLIEAEPVAIENEGPSEDSRPIENIDESKEKESSVFEE